MLHLSKIDVEKFTEHSIDEAIQNCNFEAFEKSYAILFRRFVKFLNKNGLPHNLPQEV